MQHRPPKLPLKVFKWFCHPDLFPFIEGDLLELFHEQLAQKGPFRARLIFCFEIIKLMRPNLMKLKNPTFLPGILRSVVRSSTRRLMREKVYAGTNLFGLITGFLVFLCTWMYVHYERHFDEFLPDYQEVYRMDENWNRSGITEQWSAIKARVTPYINTRFPGAISTRIFKGMAGDIRVGDKVVQVPTNFYADSTFMQVLPYPTIQGNAMEMLNQPNRVILTESLAHKLFGETPALGQTVTFKKKNFEVGGVIQDPPAYSHLHFDLLISGQTLFNRASDFNLNDNMYYTYVRIPESQAQHLKETLNENLSSLPGYADDLGVEGNTCHISLMPLRRIHLYGDREREIEQNGSYQVVNIIEAIGWFILLMSGINYINLATSRSMSRMSEVGIRKLHGSAPAMIAGQFLIESLLLCILSALIALGLSWLLLPVFNQYFELHILWSFTYARNLIIMTLGIALAFGLLSGLYPAISLSRVSIMSVLKAIGSNKGTGGVTIRRGFITFQLMIAVFTIMSMLVIFGQLNFIQNKNLGFDQRKRMVIVLNPADHYDAIHRLKESLIGQPGISGVTTSYTYPGRRFPFFTFRFPNLNANGKVTPTLEDGSIWMRTVFGDKDQVKTFGLELLKGRMITQEEGHPVEFIINEAAARFLGLEDPIGETVAYTHNVAQPENGRIVGLVRDFNYASLHHEIEPIIMATANWGWAKQYMTLSFDSFPGEVAMMVQQEWDRYLGNVPLSYRFLDDEYQELYKTEHHLQVFLVILSVISLIIATLGLLGMSFFSMEQRKHEVGVRKVLGASVASIVGLTTRDYLIMAGVAVAIVMPITYWLASRWLESFAYAIGIGPNILLGTIAFVLILVVGSVGYNVLRSAMKNPVEMLKKAG